MKIVSCFSSLTEIEPLIKAGADELYCAVKDIPSFDIGFLEGKKSLAAAAKRIHALGKKLDLAVNCIHPSYTERGLRRRFLPLLAEADAAGVDAFIVSSPSILMLLKESGVRPRAKIQLSSLQPCFNSAAARFFIQQGISRLILPNQLSSREARALFAECRKAGVETEIFDYRFFGCIYVNGRCNLHKPVFHTFRGGRDVRALCRLDRGSDGPPEIKSFDVNTERSAQLAQLQLRLSSRMSCGGPPRISNAGSFFDFFCMGTDYLKYGTRQDPSGVKLSKVKELRAMIRLAGDLTKDLGRVKARAVFMERMTGWKHPGVVTK